MDTANLVCDFCQTTSAACTCICQFPLPKVCSDCHSKHSFSAGCHFALPLNAGETVEQGNWLQWHSYLVGTSAILQNWRNSLEAFSTLQGQIEALFRDIQEELAGMQAEYLYQLQELRKPTEELVQAAIQEVCEHCLDATYISSNPVATSVMEAMRAGAIGEVRLFALKVNEVSRATLQTTLGLRVDALVMGLPGWGGNLGDMAFEEVQISPKLEKAYSSANSQLYCLHCSEYISPSSEFGLCESCLGATKATPRSGESAPLAGEMTSVAKSATCATCERRYTDEDRAYQCSKACQCCNCIIQALVGSESKASCEICGGFYPFDGRNLALRGYKQCHVCGIAIKLDEFELSAPCQLCQDCVTVIKHSILGFSAKVYGTCRLCSPKKTFRIEEGYYKQRRVVERVSACCGRRSPRDWKLKCGHWVCGTHRETLKHCRACQQVAGF